MKYRVVPKRLAAAMARKGLSVKALVRKVSRGEHEVSERTISRLLSEKETGGVRLRTIKAIATALGIEPGEVTGELPAPSASASDLSDSPGFPETRWNVRLPPSIRNAYSLVAMRYQIPAVRVAELVS